MIKLLGQMIVNNLKIAKLTAKLSMKTAQLKILNTLIRKKNK